MGKGGAPKKGWQEVSDEAGGRQGKAEGKEGEPASPAGS